MRTLAAVTALVLAGAATLGLVARSAHDENRSAARVPVLVELFTSEGCSSCPPADDLLRRLIDEQPVDGVEVVALSEHVDYWNRQGWTDPFSSPLFSTRQERYQRALRTEQIYTPQMIVNGRREAIGNDWPAVRSELTAAALGPSAVLRVAPAAAGDAVHVTVSIADIPDAAHGKMRVMVALSENDLAVDVKRGENARRRLRHSAVTRRLEAVGSVNAAERSAQVSAELTIDPAWRRDQLRVLAFLQDAATERVWGVSSPAPLVGTLKSLGSVPAAR
jgi:hypothetical protein